MAFDWNKFHKLVDEKGMTTVHPDGSKTQSKPGEHLRHVRAHDKVKAMAKKIKVNHEKHDMSFDKTVKRGLGHLKATKDARGKQI